MRVIAYAVIAMSMALGSTAEALSAPWSVTPPPDWENVSPALRARADIQSQQQQFKDKGGTFEVAAYQRPAGDSLLVVFMRVAASGNAAGQAVRNFEAGARDSSRKVGSETSYTTHERDGILIAEQVIDASGRTMWLRRLAGVDDSHLMSVSATCNGDQAVCATTLQSLTLDSTGFQPLIYNTDRGRVDRDSDAYRAGYAVGRVLTAVIIALVLLWLLVRIRRKKQPT